MESDCRIMSWGVGIMQTVSREGFSDEVQFQLTPKDGKEPDLRHPNSKAF
jgi:hypothetical protein